MFSEIEPVRFCSRFNREPFLFRHGLADHPLLGLERLRALATRLPSSSLELNAGDVPVSLVEVRSREGQSAEGALRRIAALNTWVGLKELEQLPEYRALIDRALDELQPWIARVEPGMHGRQGFAFVSSPRSIVPFHFDPEHGFLLQIAGRKRLVCFSKTDRALVTERDLERQYGEGIRKVPLPEGAEERGTVFELGPGDALHVPVSAPHFVETLDEVSVSLSLTFRTRPGERLARLYRMNHALRRRGGRPAPIGESTARDTIKYGLYWVQRGLGRSLDMLRTRKRS